jgi:hypothetical protein
MPLALVAAGTQTERDVRVHVPPGQWRGPWLDERRDGVVQVRHVEIDRFRGIRRLDWEVRGSFICLVGPGDSTKTTILEAVALALCPRWHVTFDDSDFFESDTTEPIVITVTVGQVPDALLTDDKFGLEMRGWDDTVGLRDEPDEKDEVVLSIRLKVDDSLEPSWAVVNARKPEGRPISATDREKLGVAQLGGFVDRELSWSRTSTLARLTSGGSSVAAMLADAGRAARRALDPSRLEELQSAADTAQKLGARFGVTPMSGFRPDLDLRAVSVGIGGLSLHDGEVPLRRAGLGTRRLLTLGLQCELAEARGISLIDEVEHGLEPHRIRRLLTVLRKRSMGDEFRDKRQKDKKGRHNKSSKNRNAGGNGQVLMTTHAPVVLQELEASELRVVRNQGESIWVSPVGSDLRPVVRKCPEALLGSSVLVCEGRTELGICRALDSGWSESGYSFAYLGISLADGGGSGAPSVAKGLADLGYTVAFLGDSDRPLSPDASALVDSGVSVFLWEGGVCVEQRMALDLPPRGIAAMARLAMDEWGEESVRDAISSRLGIAPGDLPREADDWLDAGAGIQDLRAAIGEAAQRARRGKGWFKRVDLAEGLGRLMLDHLAEVPDSDLAQKVAALKAWTENVR